MYDQDVTAAATLTQPLFAGGMNASRIREALENDNTQRLGLENARRQAMQAVAQGWNQLLAARGASASNSEQVKADEIAFEGVKQEADVGLRTTLDVLNAEQELRAAQLALVNARHDQYVAAAAVLNAMGQLEIANLDSNVPAYDPEKSFRAVKPAGAVPWEGLVEGLDGLSSPAIRARPASPPLVMPSQPAAPAQAGGSVVEP